MSPIYTKTTWQDRAVQFPTRYDKTNETSSQVTLTASPGTITQAGTAFTAAVMNKIEDGIETATPITGQVSTTNTGWTTTTTAGFSRTKDVAIAGVTTTMYPTVAFTTASYTIAVDANIALCETYAGGIRLYADAVPSGTVTFDYVVIRG